jgi:hypothetical protein
VISKNVRPACGFETLDLGESPFELGLVEPAPGDTDPLAVVDEVWRREQPGANARHA